MHTNYSFCDSALLEKRSVTATVEGTDWKHVSIHDEGQPGTFELLSSVCSKIMDNVVSDTLKLVKNKLDEQLVDFDDHLDNVRLDWTNSDINRALPAGGTS